jgi:hypothetical protein
MARPTKSKAIKFIGKDGNSYTVRTPPATNLWNIVKQIPDELLSNSSKVK